MQFKGTGVALVTPFNTNGSIDESRFLKLVNYLLVTGADFLAVQGTTGERDSLTTEEKERMLAIVIEENKGRLPIVLGFADNITAALVKVISTFDTDGVYGLLRASP